MRLIRWFVIALAFVALCAPPALAQGAQRRHPRAGSGHGYSRGSDRHHGRGHGSYGYRDNYRGHRGHGYDYGYGRGYPYRSPYRNYGYGYSYGYGYGYGYGRPYPYGYMAYPACRAWVEGYWAFDGYSDYWVPGYSVRVPCY